MNELLTEKTKIYFASDIHLGVPNYNNSLEREKKFISWLETVRHDAKEIYLLGDIFDFWFEYKTVVPKGYVRLLGKLAEIRDSGVLIHYFTGNHDMWMFDYFPKELNIPIYRSPVIKEYDGKKFYIGHGDGLGPADHGYKFIKAIFSNRVCQWLFARIHPNFGIGLANYFSRKSRVANGVSDEIFLGEEKEYLIQFVKARQIKEHSDYYIFGHRHLPIEMTIDDALYINLGDWVSHFTFAEWNGKTLELKKYD